MKTISLKEALEKQLIYTDSYGGICLNRLKRGDYFIIEDESNFEDVIKTIKEPSIILSDDGKKIGSFITKTENHPGFNLARSYMETLIAPRIITKNNTPIFTGAAAPANGLTKYVLQDNNGFYEEGYELCVETALGKIDSKERKIREIYVKESSAYKYGQSKDKYFEEIRYKDNYKKNLDEPVELKYINKILYINGNISLNKGECTSLNDALNVNGNINERLERIDDWNPVGYQYEDIFLCIDRKAFLQYYIYYKTEDGRTTKDINGLIERNDIKLLEFWKEVVDGVHAIVINGNIDKNDLKICDGDYTQGIFETTDLSKVNIIKNNNSFSNSSVANMKKEER